MRINILLISKLLTLTLLRSGAFTPELFCAACAVISPEKTTVRRAKSDRKAILNILLCLTIDSDIDITIKECLRIVNPPILCYKHVYYFMRDDL